MSDALKYDRNELIAKSAEQKNLLLVHGPVLEERVGADTIGVVMNGGSRLQQKSRKQVDSQANKIAATRTQMDSLDAAVSLLGDCRKCIYSEFTDPGTRRTFGLNLKIRAGSPKSIAAACEIFVNAAKANPEKVSRAAITTAEVTQLETILKQIEAGELVQEAKKNSAKVSTSTRNGVQLELEAAMIKIVNGAVLEFRERPDVVALFKATLPKSRYRRKSSKKTSVDSPSTEPESK